MEEKLRASEILLNTTGRMAKVGGWEVDAETLDVRWTDEVYRIHEVPLDYKPLLTRRSISFIRKTAKYCQKQSGKRLTTAHHTILSYVFVSAKGKRLWTHTICQPKIVDGRVVSLNGAFQDITTGRT
jgi:PAS domain-containing protein